MENQFENLRRGLEQMEIVTLAAAVEKTGLTRQEIINFVSSDKKLRIFDEQNQRWLNENVDGHC